MVINESLKSNYDVVGFKTPTGKISVMYIKEGRQLAKSEYTSKEEFMGSLGGMKGIVLEAING